jgi:hypothetical protein
VTNKLDTRFADATTKIICYIKHKKFRELTKRLVEAKLI